MDTTQPRAQALGGCRWLDEGRWPTRVELAEMWVGLRAPGAAMTASLCVAIAFVWLAIFAETLGQLIARWNADPNYSHGYLVPFVAGYLALQKLRGSPLFRDPNAARPTGGTLLGILLIGLGLLTLGATTIVPSLVAKCFAMLATLSGLTLTLGGWAWARRLWAPVGFLVFMAPWPSGVYSRIAFPLQLLVSQVAAVILQMTGIPVLRDGNLIHLPRQTMHVAEACSGLRQLTAFLAIGACAAILVQRPWWYRGLLLASSIPIAVIVNVLRVAATGLLLQYGDPAWTEGWLHTMEGMVTVALGMGLLFLEVSLLDWMLEEKPEARFESAPAMEVAI